MNEKEILEKSFRYADDLIKRERINKIPLEIREDVDFLIEKIGSNKSIVSILVTCLAKKILSPKQDVRLHVAGFEDGYSARDFDKKFTSPFFKKHFTKYANKETSFLSSSFRDKRKWTKENEQDLRIGNKNSRERFINILDQVESGKQKPQVYLIYIFAKLTELIKDDEIIFEIAEEQSQEIGLLNIHLVLEMLLQHFATKSSSRLPVIAIYSIYEILLPKFERFKDKLLLPLQSHTSSDKHGFGDIEIYDRENNPFEIIEIKHNIPIDKYLIFDVVKKTQNVKINRYYILTTFQNGFAEVESEKAVTEYILQIKRQTNLDIIANGIITTLKYYLRFIDDYLLMTTENLSKFTLRI